MQNRCSRLAMRYVLSVRTSPRVQKRRWRETTGVRCKKWTRRVIGAICSTTSGATQRPRRRSCCCSSGGRDVLVTFPARDELPPVGLGFEVVVEDVVGRG